MTGLFVNLPVADLGRSVAFFTTKFATFTPNPICDARSSTEVLLALSQPSRSAVDELVARGVAAGGTTYNQPQDHGFMYGHGFQDLDGHIWEVFHMTQAPGSSS